MTKDDFLGYKLSLLPASKSINNISKACREAGTSRTYYYKWAKRFTTYGTQGLREREKSKPKMPNFTRSDIVDRILKFIKKYPTYGPVRIANELGSTLCPSTVYNILKRRGLKRKLDRLLALEDIPALVSLSPVMARKMEEAGPLPSIESHSGYMLLIMYAG